MDNKKIENIKKNLMVQVNKIARQTNERGFKTRERYRDATERFCKFLAENYGTKKFSNVQEKHIKAYVKYMEEQGKSASTIKTDLSGIRFFHRQSGSKYVLPDNASLGLEQRTFGKVDRAWLDQEIKKGMVVARMSGREDVAQFIQLSRHFGLRMEECVTLTRGKMLEALKYGQLEVKGKGGLVRYIPLTTQVQRAVLKNALAYMEINGRRAKTDKFLAVNKKGSVKAQKKSLQNWIINNRHKFQNPDRQGKTHVQEAKREGKIVKGQLTAHGLRHTYAREQYYKEKEQGATEREARLATSRKLGHGREEVTKIYLAQAGK